jgi:hypothetical protein
MRCWRQFGNHADSFRQILQFGLEAPAVFSEIRKIVAEGLAKRSLTPEFQVPNAVKPGVEGFRGSMISRIFAAAVFAILTTAPARAANG